MQDGPVTNKRLTPYVCSVSIVGMLLWLLWPVLGTAFVADDIPNSQRSAGLAAANESLIDFTFRLTRQWMQNEGRFFPVSVFENALIFDTIHSRFLYKVLEMSMVCLLIFVTALFIWLLTQRWSMALLVVAFFCVALQVRVWYDPTISFGVLLPSTGVKALTALCCVLIGIRRNRAWESNLLMSVAAVLWLLALMQYEIVLLLSVIALFIVLHENTVSWTKRFTALLAIALPSAIFLLISRITRSGVTASPAYDTNFSLSAISRALKYQILGAVPLSVPYSRVDKRFGLWGATADLSIIQIVFCIALAVVVAYLVWLLDYPELKTRLTLAGTALSLLVLPAIPTSLSVRWQNELGPGHAYLPVMLQYLGTALFLLLLAVELQELVRRFSDSRASFRKLLPAVTAVAVATLCVSVVYTNRSGIEYTRDSYNGFKTDREIFEAATRHGLLERSLANGILLSATYDPALWVNKEYISWLGGPQISSFGKPQDSISCRANGKEECQQSNGGLYLVEYSENGDATAVIVTLQNWWLQPNRATDLIKVSAISLERENLLCGKTVAKKVSGWWVSRCLIDDGTILQKIQAQYTT